ncbi:hypothetical protein ARMGADRAFT_930529 [Armillaria gallica]|uniref:Uncharacterized protein n=1 Tax=Armillaria gallica TaxID=47427 RepID=A0A2H3DFS4_ARMGA|nr:hypothetical protein ARMGADRAFT_930529 [Armillaria gallica]
MSLTLGHFANHWDTTFMSREDIASMGKPYLNAQFLNAADALGLILYYLGSEFYSNSVLILSHYPLLHGTFGSIDGLSLPAQEFDPKIENATNT